VRRLSLVLLFLSGAMVLPRLSAAEDILTICGCPPNACPAGYTEFASGTTPLATGCSGGCVSGVTPWWRQCTRCGDGYCRSGLENGSICGQDCCDSSTSCGQIRATSTDEYCRRFKTDSGLWGPWQWITPASYNLGWCSDPVRHLCHSHANCASTESICADVVNVPHWKVLPASCP
jgi:hypothetical protein